MSSIAYFINTTPYDAQLSCDIGFSCPAGAGVRDLYVYMLRVLWPWLSLPLVSALSAHVQTGAKAPSIERCNVA